MPKTIIFIDSISLGFIRSLMRIDRIVQNNLLGCTLVFYNVLSVGRRWKNAFEKICCNRATYYISKCSNFNICQYRKLNNMSLSGLKQVLVDLSGTVHIEDEEVAGSIEAFERLRNSDLGVKFVTNTTKESKRELLQRLTKIGFDIKSSEIFTSLTAARNLVEKRGVRPMLMLDKRALEDFQGINTDNPNAVVVGLAPEEFNYQTMNTAFRLIMDGAPLIAIHKARYYKRSDGLALGPGPFVLALEYATGVTAEVVGKPEKSFFTSAVEEFHCDPGHCVMIGDDARDDINGATQAGMLGILVRTGKYLEGDENKLTSSDSSFTVDNFSSAVDLILKHLPNTCR